jgi:hypothetical protein
VWPSSGQMAPVMSWVKHHLGVQKGLILSRFSWPLSLFTWSGVFDPHRPGTGATTPSSFATGIVSRYGKMLHDLVSVTVSTCQSRNAGSIGHIKVAAYRRVAVNNISQPVLTPPRVHPGLAAAPGPPTTTTPCHPKSRGRVVVLHRGTRGYLTPGHRPQITYQSLRRGGPTPRTPGTSQTCPAVLQVLFMMRQTVRGC